MLRLINIYILKNVKYNDVFIDVKVLQTNNKCENYCQLRSYCAKYNVFFDYKKKEIKYTKKDAQCVNAFFIFLQGVPKTQD